MYFCFIASLNIFFLYKIQRGCVSLVALVRTELDHILKDVFKKEKQYLVAGATPAGIFLLKVNNRNTRTSVKCVQS